MHPDLAIWQVGTNAVLRRDDLAADGEWMHEGVDFMKRNGIDVVLMDLQYAPLVLASERHARMEQIIADVAREQNVGQFPRFLLMKRAIEAGVKGLVWWDGLHNSTEGYKCVGLALAQMIDAASR